MSLTNIRCMRIEENEKIADREPDRTDEMWTQIGVHLSHFVEIYGMK